MKFVFKKSMQNISPTTKAYFIYFISYANAVLGCRKETIKLLFRNYSICYLDYSHKDGSQDKSLEIQIDKGYLFCDFDEFGVCEASYVFFDKMDNIDEYIALFNQLLEYNAISKSWQLLSNFIMYLEDEDERYFGFFLKNMNN